jgi:alpha-1,2-mannosyltransferase
MLLRIAPDDARRRSPTRIVRILIVGVSGLLVTIAVVGIPGVPPIPFGLADQYRLDLDVYRLGARAWVSGTPLYGPDFPVTGLGLPLPFVYPPVAAVLFTPLLLVSLAAASVLMTLLSIAAAARVSFLAIRASGLRIDAWRFAALLPLVVLTDPVRMTVLLGQINLLLLLAVATDTLGGSHRRARGVLVGVAAAVKLTPLVFVVWFLIRGDRRAAANAIGAFGAVTGIGFLLAPGESVRFWTEQVFGLDALLSPALPNNQNLRAVIVRLGLGATSSTLLWCAVAGGALVLGVVAAVRWYRAGEALLGMATL